MTNAGKKKSRSWPGELVASTVTLSVRMLHTVLILLLVLEYVTLAIINIVIVHRSDQIYPHLVETVLGECNFTPRVFSDVILILLKKNVEKTRMSTVIFTARYTWHGGAPACFHTRSYLEVPDGATVA